jgi:glycosyltransferase involved in cell wall biosynthesis
MPDGMTWEVLVVDNNSTDRTREIVEEFSRRYPGRFRYLFEPRAGKSYALNAGITQAKGDVAAFMDDDVTVAPDWLQNLTAPLADGAFACTGGRVAPVWKTDPPHWLGRDGWVLAGPLVSFDRGEQGCRLEECPVGTNMAFPLRVFQQYGGFRVDLGPTPHNEIRNEDSEFVRRLLKAGEQLYYVPSAVVYHPVTEDRLNQRYFLTWWFDKARSEIRELGVPRDQGWLIGGIPLNTFRRLLRWSMQWTVTLNSRSRFECKLKVWYAVGLMAECRSHTRSQPVLPEGVVGSRPIS